jgi:hypothetical protein
LIIDLMKTLAKLRFIFQKKGPLSIKPKNPS